MEQNFCLTIAAWYFLDSMAPAAPSLFLPLPTASSIPCSTEPALQGFSPRPWASRLPQGPINALQQDALNRRLKFEGEVFLFSVRLLGTHSPQASLHRGHATRVSVSITKSLEHFASSSSMFFETRKQGTKWAIKSLRQSLLQNFEAVYICCNQLHHNVEDVEWDIETIFVLYRVPIFEMFTL